MSHRSLSLCFFFQAEDGIRDLVRSRGLGDVYKRQVPPRPDPASRLGDIYGTTVGYPQRRDASQRDPQELSLIHI